MIAFSDHLKLYLKESGPLLNGRGSLQFLPSKMFLEVRLRRKLNDQVSTVNTVSTNENTQKSYYGVSFIAFGISFFTPWVFWVPLERHSSIIVLYIALHITGIRAMATPLRYWKTRTPPCGLSRRPTPFLPSVQKVKMSTTPSRRLSPSLVSTRTQ